MMILVLTFAAVSCGSEGPAEGEGQVDGDGAEEAAPSDADVNDLVVTELQDNEDLWATAGSENYQFTYTSTCGENDLFTDVPTTVLVTDGVPEMVDGPDFTPQLPTVEELHSQIANAATAEVVSVTYGDAGQPLQIDIDFSTNATDDEFCIDVTEFELL